MDSPETPPQTPEPDNGRTVVRLQRRRDGTAVGVDGQRQAHEPELHETVRGKTGARFLRLTRAGEQKLRRVSENEFEATKVVLRPATTVGRAWYDIRHFFIGQTLASSELSHERLSKVKALAIFSSDALSSSAYATEEILLALIVAGTMAMSNSIPIAIMIALLTVIVVTSYRQTIRAYPNGGGAYIVANENLGLAAGLIAGSALLVDYIMTVAVSTAAGVSAITSAVPELRDLRIEFALGSVLIITLANLRGIRESGTIFAIPTYFFIFSFGAMIIIGLTRLALGHDLHAPEAEDAIVPGTQALTLFVLMRAFASGSAALTGIEAVANGVPSFQPPEAKNAATTQVWMAVILMAFFVGVTILAHQLDVSPSEHTTVVAQIAEAVFGRNAVFFVIQGATVLILLLAANTAYAGLPVLASVMARDSAMPKQFAFRGDRLAFTNGILFLGIASALVLWYFHADTHKIIPLYAFGVFMAFTLSQAGMVIHWRRVREPGWRRALVVNLVGATVTAIVAVIVGATKFTHGAWLSMAIMGVLAFLCYMVYRHYRDAANQLTEGLIDANGVAQHFYSASAGRPQTVIVPVEKIDRAVLRTIAYARTLSPNAVAVHVTDEHESADRLRAEWEQSIPDMPLVVVESPYRSLVEPLIAYIEGMDRTQPNQVVTVVLPEFIPKHFWQKFLHNQLPLRLKKALVNRPNTVLVDVPYHLR